MIVDERVRLRLRRRLGLSLRPPRGWETGPPDFVGIGAQRSGTSWWFGQISRHPAVVAPSGKELHYFDRFWNAEFTATDGDGYRALLPRPPGKTTGEWTPRYMYDPWTLPLLQLCAPTAKILVLLRDPWDRFISGLGHERRVFARELHGRRERDLGLMIRADAFRRSIVFGSDPECAASRRSIAALDPAVRTMRDRPGGRARADPRVSRSRSGAHRDREAGTLSRRPAGAPSGRGRRRASGNAGCRHRAFRWRWHPRSTPILGLLPDESAGNHRGEAAGSLLGPDFFIVGAPKCGTTAMAAYLGQHPEIGMCPRKESHVFATDLKERMTRETQ